MGKIYYDFHIHSCLSPCGDDDMTPANIAGMAHINGLNAIALTDHNTIKNCQALKNVAEKYSITVLYGMELTTDEEVHVVCLFADLSSAEKWNDYVYQRLQKIKNNPQIFGHQYVMNEEDKVLDEEENLLINAVNISFEEVFPLVDALGGVAFPAHLDKSANSLLANLGFIPPDSTFTVAELHNISTLDNLKSAHPYLNVCKILSNSDAHYLQDISMGENYLEIENPTAENIIKYLKGS